MLAALLKPFFKKTRRKNFLLLLWEEMNTNLDRYHVIDQQQFISAGFELVAWEEAKHFSGVSFSKEILDYALVLEAFNAALADVQAYERIYSSSLEHKTLEHAQVLHAKKEALDGQVQAIYPVIVQAQKTLRSIMDKRGAHA